MRPAADTTLLGPTQEDREGDAEAVKERMAVRLAIARSNSAATSSKQHRMSATIHYHRIDAGEYFFWRGIPSTAYSWLSVLILW
jgi:hypothetical protein